MLSAEQEKFAEEVVKIAEKRNIELKDELAAQIAMADRIGWFVYRLRKKEVSDEMIVEILKNLEVY